MQNVLKTISRNKQFREGALLRPDHFQLPFKQNMNLLTAMFELRKWFLFNSPHKLYAEKYSNEMAYLHNELNYQHARLLLKRGAVIFGLIYAYFWFITTPDAIDWKDTFDLKFNEKAYGSLNSSAGEGGASIDE